MPQDARDPNPLIRALAVRTMGCIRVDKITEYLCDPLQLCLKVRHSQKQTKHADAAVTEQSPNRGLYTYAIVYARPVCVNGCCLLVYWQ